ncbi:aldo/keto reductase [Nocardioides panacis]|uniref:Aldo/keto reductase n=1 Tax=Nocardioides panacis TaxID=2849501 RepID=A0A975XYP1_9ACTN|nr:aldo/keto reductase [Nocardioides panacis]QWZ06518.1 aldo/keto reductase [Nocardioides panacis]
MSEHTTPHLPTDSVTLTSGAAMPLLGFGTWQIKGSQATDAAAAALEAGYRHLDTATVYGNEGEVGKALAESGVARDDVFVTTKCPPSKPGLATLRESLDLLGTDHVDLWLIHWPGSDGDVALWKDFVAAREGGLARDIGVSNFDAAMIDRLTSETGVTPAVNQIEWSPLLHDRDVVEQHRSRGVVLEGYSALRGGTLEHPVIVEIADRLGRTPAQVIVRWHLQHGIVVIPKSRQADRIRSNADVGDFELTVADLRAIDALGPNP